MNCIIQMEGCEMQTLVCPLFQVQSVRSSLENKTSRITLWQRKCILCLWKWINSTCFLDPNHDCNIGTEKTSGNISQFLAYSRKLGNRRSSEGLQNFKPSKGTNLLTLIILAGDIEMNPGPRFLCRLCKKHCKASNKFVTCNDCEKRFHATCTNPRELFKNQLEKVKMLHNGNNTPQSMSWVILTLWRLGLQKETYRK